MHLVSSNSCVATIALILVFTASAAHAETREQCEKTYAPRIGAEGKDVIWVPTLDALTTAMLKAANVTAKDYVVDLGAGDGKIPIAAAKMFGAKSLGVEYNPQLVKLAQCYVRAEGVADKVEIRQGDIFATDFSDATVLTLYLLSDLNMKLRPTILKMKPGTRVVSNTFKMGDWSPDEFIESGIGNARAYLWVVPAQVAGVWRFQKAGSPDAFRVHLSQRHQELKGELLGAARAFSLRNARVRGEEVEFTLMGYGPEALVFRGRARADRIHGVVEWDGKLVNYVGTRG